MGRWKKKTKYNKRKRGKSSYVKKNKKYKSSAQVQPQGDSAGSYSKSRTKTRRIKKVAPSLVSRVKKLESVFRAAPKTISNFINLKISPYKMKNTLPGKKTTWSIPFITKSVIETHVSSNVDATLITQNSKFNVMGVAMKLVIRSSSVFPQTIKCCWFVCNDDDSQDIRTEMDNLWSDRGVPAFTLGGSTPQSASTAHVPAFIQQDVEAANFAVSPLAAPGLGKKWKKISKCSYYTLGPGDSYTTKAFVKKITYRPEIQDREGDVNLKNITHLCLIEVTGTPVHSTAVNSQVVGYGPTSLDAIGSYRFNVPFDDGLAQTKYFLENDMTTAFQDGLNVSTEANAIEEEHPQRVTGLAT